MINMHMNSTKVYHKFSSGELPSHPGPASSDDLQAACDVKTCRSLAEAEEKLAILARSLEKLQGLA